MEMQAWRDFLIPYDQAVQELLVKFRNIQLEYKSLGQYSPIEQITGRVKSIHSILEKMGKRDIGYEDLEKELSDIAGIRIICQFVEDIDSVVSLIRERKDMAIIEETNYVDNMKNSGYRSYHIVINYPVCTVLGTKTVRAEIQIRTMAMNFWATIEHSLQYKYQGHVPEEIQKRLKGSAEACLHLDQEMSAIRNEITEAQGLFQERSQMVKDILSNVQSIYANSEKIAMQEARDQLFEMVRDGEFDKIKDFGAEIDAVAQHHGIQHLPPV